MSAKRLLEGIKKSLLHRWSSKDVKIDRNKWGPTSTVQILKKNDSFSNAKTYFKRLSTQENPLNEPVIVSKRNWPFSTFNFDELVKSAQFELDWYFQNLGKKSNKREQKRTIYIHSGYTPGHRDFPRKLKKKKEITPKN